MGGAIADAQTDANNIVADIHLSIPGARFALASASLNSRAACSSNMPNLR